MTRSTFAIICGELLIDISTALESDAIQEALTRNASSEEIRDILKDEF